MLSNFNRRTSQTTPAQLVSKVAETFKNIFRRAGPTKKYDHRRLAMKRAMFALALLFAAASTQQANAFWGCSGFGTNYYGYGLAAGWYTGVNDRVPPYFALHPPVYYSGEIVRIPYGASPFAAPWGTPYGMRTSHGAPIGMSTAPAIASAPSAEPVTIENEFYEAGGANALPAPKSSALRSTGNDAGFMIVNPFYKSARDVATR